MPSKINDCFITLAELQSFADALPLAEREGEERFFILPANRAIADVLPRCRFRAHALDGLLGLHWFVWNPIETWEGFYTHDDFGIRVASALEMLS